LNIKSFAYIWQSGDSPGDFDQMRLNTIRLRPFSKGVVFAADQMYWDEGTPEAEVAKFIMTSVMIGVPAFGPTLIWSPPETLEMLRAWLRFYRDFRTELATGKFSPFGQLTRQQRRELFPKSGKRGYIFTPEQLRGLYALAGWRRPFVRFAVHTGMRFGELLTLRWACVNLEQRIAIVEARYAKNGREREVPLGEVAFGLLEGVRPERPAAEALVFRAPSGKAIKSVGTWWNAAVIEVWKPSRPSAVIRVAM
jgi:hypothetical protein